jgi:hypothetical protein
MIDWRKRRARRDSQSIPIEQRLSKGLKVTSQTRTPNSEGFPADEAGRSLERQPDRLFQSLDEKELRHVSPSPIWGPDGQQTLPVNNVLRNEI